MARTEANREFIDVAIGHVTNRPAKSAAYIELDASDIDPTESELSSAVNDRFELGLPPDHAAKLGSYALTFRKAGVAVAEKRQSHYNKRIVTGYTAEQAASVIPVTGSMLEWGKAHPETPTLHILGHSSVLNTNVALDAVNILEGSLEGKKARDIPHAHTRDLHTPRKDKLIVDGIIKPVDPVGARILDPVYSGKTPEHARSDDSKKVYDTLARAFEIDPQREWTLDQLCAVALEVEFPGEQKPSDADISRIRKNLRIAMSKDFGAYYQGAMAKVDLRIGALEVVEAHRAAVEDVVERVRKLQALDPSTLEEGRDFVATLLDEPDTVRQTIVDDLDQSPYNRG